MRYKAITEAVFLERPNRFIAYVELFGKKETVHVKNTGRCKELLQKGVSIYLEKSDNPKRRTAYDLVAVKKGDRLINMDSQAPNKAVEEWLKRKELFPGMTLLRPETTYKNSRFDFYIECGQEKVFIEVKGVTLEEDGVVSFPDAPSERAVRHLEELIEAKQDGYQVYVLFVVQMKGVKYLMPNARTHPEFAKALGRAKDAGVRILAYDCIVTPEEMKLDTPVPVQTGSLSELTGPLLDWYGKNRRILPWREEITPYRVWVSEIMLQQTRVEAVKPYFARFMENLPDIPALAEAEEEKLLKLWEGLGYYNRVRNMQKAAQKIMEEYGGRMPEHFEVLRTLPGIGDYTAGAIASIVFGEAVPAVDGNVLRVVSRLTGESGDITNQTVRKKLQEKVSGMIPVERAGDFTQAMIELGALVCVPNGVPHCEQCPFANACLAHQHGREQEFPCKPQKTARRIEKKTVLLLLDGSRVALQKRPDQGLLAGMYEFPMLEGWQKKKEILRFCEAAGLSPLHIQPLADAKHVFSHVEWHMKGYAVRVDELRQQKTDENKGSWLFVEPCEAGERYPIPSAFKAFTRHLNILRGNDTL